MLNTDSILHFFLTFLPTLGVVIFSSLILWACHFFLIGRRPELGSERKFPFQLALLVLAIISSLAIVISLPIDTSFRNQIISLFGILLSGIIAFSSTNIISNLMAGVLLRITKPFKTGDFISVGQFFGRVSERGLFDTEIQSENRELIAIPNTFIINNPVTTTRNSGAIVSATLSLGYDVHYLQIEPLLIEAAEKSGLKEPFVNILELGNFAVTYRVSGLLIEVKGLLTARSNLFRGVLDSLHGHDIEIMSPSFVNQIRKDDDKKVIPNFYQTKSEKKTSNAEEIIFDKAEQAELEEETKQTEVEKNEEMKEIKTLASTLKKNKDTAV